MTSGGQAEDRQGLGQDLDGLRVPLVNDSRDDESTSFNAGIKTQTGQVDEGEERAHSASARPKTTTESVPRIGKYYNSSSIFRFSCWLIFFIFGFLVGG